MKPASIGNRWEERGGRPDGFDLLRITLATSVIFWHTIRVCYGPDAETPFWTGPLRPFPFLIVPAFFAMSGFLVMASLARNGVTGFLILRALRIFPALAVEAAVSALIIGPMFTALPLKEYFGSEMFRNYFLNATGNIHYFLPGVFTDLPGGSVVDLQLWTIPFEIRCYLLLAAAALLGLLKNRIRFAALLATTLLATTAVQSASGTLPVLVHTATGTMVLFSFFSGVLLFLMRDAIRLSPFLLFLSLVSCCALIYLRAGMYLASLPLAYATIYIGLKHLDSPLIRMSANYSYGIYLYGFPVQQAISALLPGWRIWYVNFVLSFLITLILAMLSWHLLESKIRDRKKTILNTIQNIKGAP